MSLLLAIFIAFLVSLAVTLAIVRSSTTHAHLSNDHDLSGPQKFHARPVPRIGGMGILCGLAATMALIAWRTPAVGHVGLMLVLCAMPAFLSGLAEDVTKSVSPRRRLFFTALSSLLGVFLLGAVLDRTGVWVLEWLVAWPALAIASTVFLISGVTNAVNIIDGFNGLASMCVSLMLLATAYVAFQVGDMFVLTTALVLAGAIAGFFVWNFPAGMIFLGDGGAYLLGFLVAELSILLLHRNPSVSPMFPLLVCIYPIFETLFSIYRKKFIRKMSPGVPDGVHLHMLVYKRLMRWAVGREDAKALTLRNSMTSPYLWTLTVASVVPATLFWNDTRLLLACIFLFAFSYVGVYWRIVRFRTPKWLIRRS